MAWRGSPSMADRLKALQVRDSLIKKQDPTTAVSTAPIAQLFNDIDRSVTDLTSKMNSLVHLLDDQRAAGIDEQTLVALQRDMKNLEAATLSIKEPLAAIKLKHASLVQMQPLGPMSGAPDPMMASQQQQSPMNMPTDMSGGMAGGM